MQKDDIDLEELIKGLYAFYKAIWAVKVPLIIYAFIFALIFGGTRKLMPKEFESNSKLFLSKKNIGNSIFNGMISSMIGSQFTEGVSEENFMDIAKTKEVLKSVFTKDAVINKKSDILANHFLSEMEWESEWHGTKCEGFKFKSSNYKSFSYLEDSIFNEIHAYMIDNAALNSSIEGIINVSIEGEKEELIMNITNIWVDEMIGFFQEKTTGHLALDLEVQKRGIDSIQNMIFLKDQELAALQDGKNAIVKAKAFLEEARIRRELEIFTLMLTEQYKNYELLKYNYSTQKPIVEIVERAKLPLSMKKKSITLWLIIGGFMGILFALFFHLFLPYIRKVNQATTV